MMLYTDINHHVGTPKQKQNTKEHSLSGEFRFQYYSQHGLRVVDYYNEIVRV